ncbi:MAG TPA: geranylgeranylglycerol-phosphate geranylgeranyltransferase [Bacteroidales bacterium]|nr:geranylgeranylglycerol-phosphate geranylgeranyltransferase [Bacteroidales bacterium]HPT12564.1 geranylgeranylglycerol-phosphate geranylgeranyltransferase [Bacteroidales bacterium]
MKHIPGNSISDFLRLIRFQNLLIVALTMILMRYAILRPLLNAFQVEMIDNPGILVPMVLQTKWYDFFILVVSTVFITAAGYVINDYFDIRTDLINRGSIIVGNTVSRRSAMMYHNILNILGVAGGFYVSWRIGFFWMGVLFLLVSGLLYFYSVTYKRQFLIGNIVIAFLTALVPFLVVIFDAPSIYRYYLSTAISFPGVSLLFFWVGGFALFAFLTTLIREIVKDIEDYEGDRTYGRRTLPVVAGIMASKIVANVIIALTVFALYFVWQRYINDRLTLGYITLLIVAPLVYAGIMTIRSKSREGLHRASSILKLVMFVGLLYSVLAGYIITTGNFI